MLWLKPHTLYLGGRALCLGVRDGAPGLRIVALDVVLAPCVLGSVAGWGAGEGPGEGASCVVTCSTCLTCSTCSLADVLVGLVRAPHRLSAACVKGTS